MLKFYRRNFVLFYFYLTFTQLEGAKTKSDSLLRREKEVMKKKRKQKTNKQKLRHKQHGKNCFQVITVFKQIAQEYVC